MLGRRWLAIWVHSNSLIKNLTPFEDYAEIRFLDFLMHANSQKILLSRWLHSKLISTLKFLSNWKTMFWVISQQQHSIKTLEFTETNSYFDSFTYEKNIFSSLSFQWVDFFCEFVGRQKSCGFNTKIFSACRRYKSGFFFPLHKIQMSKQQRLIN